MSKNIELIKIFKEVFNLDNTTEDFYQLSQKNLDEWDSLNHLNLIIKLEEMFKIDISPEEMAELVSFEKILIYLDRDNSK